MNRLVQDERFGWFCKQTALKRLYLVCALLTTVSAGYMLKKSQVQRKDVRSVGPFFTLPTQHWTYLPKSSFRHTHYQSDSSVDASNLTKFHLRTLPSGYTTAPCSAKTSPHEAKRERVGEERTKPVSPTHTSLLSSLKELLYSPTWRGAKALCPAKNKLTFIDRVRRLFGKEELRCCFWTEHLVHKHSACKAEKHGNGIMGGCGAVGECFDQHMELQLLTRKDLPPR